MGILKDAVLSVAISVSAVVAAEGIRCHSIRHCTVLRRVLCHHLPPTTRSVVLSELRLDRQEFPSLLKASGNNLRKIQIVEL
jgi:hypothetical protein